MQQLQDSPNNADRIYKNTITQNASYCNNSIAKECGPDFAIQTQNIKLLFEVDPKCEYISKRLKENPDRDFCLCCADAMGKGKLETNVHFKQIMNNDGGFDKILAYEKEEAKKFNNPNYHYFSDILYKHVVCKDNKDNMNILFKLDPQYIKHYIVSASKGDASKIFNAAQNNSKVDILKNVLKEIQTNNTELNENLRTKPTVKELYEKLGIN